MVVDVVVSELVQLLQIVDNDQLNSMMNRILHRSISPFRYSRRKYQLKMFFIPLIEFEDTKEEEEKRSFEEIKVEVELVVIVYFQFSIVRFHRLIEHLMNSIEFVALNHSKTKISH